jgi:hypothetical protein
MYFLLYDDVFYSKDCLFGRNEAKKNGSSW